MSRIAILDSWVDPAKISPRSLQYINICRQDSASDGGNLTHGTICAMVLDHCTTDYDLVNLQVIPNYKDGSIKTFGSVDALAEALDLCIRHDVDIVSMSAVTSLLSDSKVLYDKVKKLSEKAVIVAALDNAKYVTVPASYPFVLGVQNDSLNLLNACEIAPIQDGVFNTDIAANCNFRFLLEMDCFPSNSFAVPVVTAYINNLLNREKLMPAEVFRRIKTLPEYAGSDALFAETVKIMKLVSNIKPKPPAIYAYIQSSSNELCIKIMDWLFEFEETQSCAIMTKTDQYDIRCRKYSPSVSLTEQIQHMEWFYKTDIVFVCDQTGELDHGIEFDVKIFCDDYKVTVEAGQKKYNATFAETPELLYKILDEG